MTLNGRRIFFKKIAWDLLKRCIARSRHHSGLAAQATFGSIAVASITYCSLVVNDLYKKIRIAPFKDNIMRTKESENYYALQVLPLNYTGLYNNINHLCLVFYFLSLLVLVCLFINNSKIK